MERKKIDCRWSNGHEPCSVTIVGREDEIIPIAIHHVVHHHGHAETPELHAGIRDSIKPEGSS